MHGGQAAGDQGRQHAIEEHVARQSAPTTNSTTTAAANSPVPHLSQAGLAQPHPAST